MCKVFSPPQQVAASVASSLLVVNTCLLAIASFVVLRSLSYVFPTCQVRDKMERKETYWDRDQENVDQENE
jgi:hypothetical protein